MAKIRRESILDHDIENDQSDLAIVFIPLNFPCLGRGKLEMQRLGLRTQASIPVSQLSPEPDQGCLSPVLDVKVALRCCPRFQTTRNLAHWNFGKGSDFAKRKTKQDQAISTGQV